jgi:hypothetical protein
MENALLWQNVPLMLPEKPRRQALAYKSFRDIIISESGMVQ